MRAQDGGIGGATALLGSGVIDKDYGRVSFGNIFIVIVGEGDCITATLAPTLKE